MRPALLLLAVALAAAPSLLGCGGEVQRDVDPEALLDSALGRPIPSAVTEVDLELAVDGVRQLSEPARLSAEGPYVSGGGERIPSFDWAVDADLAGYGLDAEVVSTGENVFLSLFGDNYQVGEAAIGTVNARIQADRPAPAAGPGPFADLGVQPRPWFASASYEGDEEVGGAETAHVAAPLRGGAVSEDLNALGARVGVAEGMRFRDGTIDAWIGIEDQSLRKLELVGDFTVPPARREELRGATGGTLGVSIALEELGEQQEITIPEGGGFKPIGRLIESINDLTSGAFALGLA